MARLETEGFEMGDVLWFDVNAIDNVLRLSAVITTNIRRRSGSYCCYMYTSGSWAHKYIPSRSEIFVRWSSHFVTNWTRPNLVAFYNGDTILASVKVESSSKLNLMIGNTNVVTDIPYAYSTLFLFELHLKIHQTEGLLELMRDGVVIASYEGNTQVDSITEIDGVRWFGGHAVAHYFDDIAINDTLGEKDNSWCGNGRVVITKLNGDGEKSDLTNSNGDKIDNFTYVDEIPHDGDVSYVESNVKEEYDLYGLQNLVLPEHSKIDRAMVCARAKTEVVGSLATIIKTNGEEYESEEIELATDYNHVAGDSHTVNPSTGLRWKESEINSSQAGVKIK